MSHSASASILPADLSRTLGPRRGTLLRASLTVSAVGLIVALGHAAMLHNGARRFALAYLVAVAFVLSLSLGALFFVFIQHLARAGWSVLFRRIAEAVAANMTVVALLFLPVAATVAVGSTTIYPWAVWHVQQGAAPDAGHAVAVDHADAHATADPSHFEGYPHQRLDELTLKKRAWLNPGFFLVRWAIYLGIWSWMGWWFWRGSCRQDSSETVADTLRSESMAGPAALVYALTLTLAANDLLTSLNPHWYSTIFGVYFFAGSAMAAFALLILLILSLQRLGVLTAAIGVEHTHDLGKFLFAFVFFWAYIAYSQYMLLWYAHIPETTGWLVHRGASTAQPNGWSIVLIALAVGHFALPFAVLMSRHVKRRSKWLAAGAGWLLLMHWLDLAWIVMPELGPDLALGGVELGLLAAVGGVYAAGLAWRLAKAPLVAVGDPRLLDSVAFENI